MLALVAALVFAQVPPDVRARRPAVFHATSRTSSAPSHVHLGLLEFAPADGTGMGTECACAAVTGTRGEPLTFTRASPATCLKTDGTLATCAPNQPRVEKIDNILTLREEGAGINYALAPRAFDDAAWVKEGNVVAAPTVTANTGTDVYGGSTADEIAFPAVPAGSNQLSQIKQAVTTPSSVATCSVSLQAKTAPGDLYLWLYNGTNNYSNRLTVATTRTRYSVSGTGASTTWTCHLGANTWGPGHSAINAITVYASAIQIETTAAPTRFMDMDATGDAGFRANELARLPWPAGVTNTTGCVRAYAYKDGWTGTALPTVLGGQGNTMGIFAGTATDLSGHDGTNSYSRTGLASLVGRTEFVRLYWWPGATNKIGFHVPGSADWVSTQYDGALTAATLNVGSLDGTSRHWGGNISRIVMNDTDAGCPP